MKMNQKQISKLKDLANKVSEAIWLTPSGVEIDQNDKKAMDCLYQILTEIENIKEQK